MVEYGCQTGEEVKARQRELKENRQRTNSDRKETGTQINKFQRKEETNI